MERENGTRVIEPVPYCTRLYGYYLADDRCYAVPEILEVVKEMYRLCKENKKLKQAVR